MDLNQKIEDANRSGNFTLLVFYTDWSPHYEWIEPVIHEFSFPINIIRINMENNQDIADKFDVTIAPSFVLMNKDVVRWEKSGMLYPGELKDVIEMFRKQ